MSETVAVRDPYVIGEDQVRCLAQLLEFPTHHVQRCVEHLTFLPRGGQQWARCTQIQMPIGSDDKPVWRVVSLGMFRRRRFPDFQVRDGHGGRLNLLTRHQHGSILTQAMLTKYLLPFSRQLEALEKEPDSSSRVEYDGLVWALYELFTTAGGPEDEELCRLAAQDISKHYAGYLDACGHTESDYMEEKEKLEDELIELQGVTQYLCWVQALPGEVVNLEATYTVEDARSPLFWDYDPSVDPDAQPIVTEPDQSDKKRLELYRQFGFAPLNYAFRIPSHDHTGSYYFTLQPPSNSNVTFMSWDSGNSLDRLQTEVDSALHTVHIHNESDPVGGKYGGVINAFIRSHPREHKKVASGALLNAIFVILAATGHWSVDIASSGAQVWLLLTPTILIAYLAEQQRHYYSHATKLQRGVLWWYLLISITFLIVLSFSVGQNGRSDVDWAWPAWIMGG